eukprot:8321055-Pyramimonas_sp.AAC.2
MDTQGRAIRIASTNAQFPPPTPLRPMPSGEPSFGRATVTLQPTPVYPAQQRHSPSTHVPKSQPSAQPF